MQHGSLLTVLVSLFPGVLNEELNLPTGENWTLLTESPVECHKCFGRAVYAVRIDRFDSMTGLVSYCSPEARIFKALDFSHAKLNELEISVNQLSLFNSKIITEYDNFKSYTSGIDQIGSNTPEWKKLKSTKKLVKKEISNYEKEAINTIKLAEGFQKYFDDSILPNVNYVNLKEHKDIYKNSISKLKSQLIQYDSEVKRLGEEINTIIANKKKEYPDLCKQLDEKGIEIQLYYDEMKEILETAQFTWNRFNLLTKDKEKVYSCSIDWNLIPNIQNQIADLNRELTAKQEKINANNAQIESIILQIGN
jgi:hypothetical protein